MLVFFSYSNNYKQFFIGSFLAVSGYVQVDKSAVVYVNPSIFFPLLDISPKRLEQEVYVLQPVYKTPRSLTPNKFTKFIKEALSFLLTSSFDEHKDDWIPAALRYFPTSVALLILANF